MKTLIKIKILLKITYFFINHYNYIFNIHMRSKCDK